MFSKKWLSFCYQVPVVEKCLELGLLYNLTPYKLCMERIFKHFTNNEMKEFALNAALYYFWIDCGLIDVTIILNFHDYMMKKKTYIILRFMSY